MAVTHAPRSSRAARTEGGMAPAGRPGAAVTSSPRMLAQRHAIHGLFGAAAPRVMQLGKKDYPYGSANSVPHVHQYGPDSHLKILGSRGLKRYNIVQNGKRHAQADEALAEAQASGNADLIAVVQDLIDNA